MRGGEFNFDGLVGPTHNYAGLSFGNVASLANRDAVSHPRAAALQGLAKVRTLAALGVPQAVLPPQERPDIAFLRAHDFGGTDAAVIEAAHRRAPGLLTIASSASAMWTANAATVSPSADCGDGRVHFTVANLAAKPHRALEVAQTQRTLRAIFGDAARFAVHPALDPATHGGDEGAANHTRFTRDDGTDPGREEARGIELFVFGADNDAPDAPRPARFPARQTLRASRAIAAHHELAPDAVVIAQQNPAAIDAGAFHHDVVAVGHRRVHFVHEDAFAAPFEVRRDLDTAYHRICGAELRWVIVPRAEVPLGDAIASYLFNSQLVTRADGATVLIAPAECERTPSVRAWLERNVGGARDALAAVHFLDLRESMRNGGGPACLRLRVALNANERAVAAPGVFWSAALDAALVSWVQRHHREELRAVDLADPSLLEESRRALDELTQLLGLGSLYPFQRA